MSKKNTRLRLDFPIIVFLFPLRIEAGLGREGTALSRLDIKIRTAQRREFDVTTRPKG